MIKTQGELLDVFIIGGGISGAAIAAECAGRGLSVTLCDRNDVGGASSSQSDQILPGAVQFLRSHNLPYFNKVIKEKARLRQRAPHLCRERPFVVVPVPNRQPSPISRIWLWLFQNWLQGGNTAGLAKRHPDRVQAAPLRPQAGLPWVMEESMVDDARLVIENLLFAEQHQGSIWPHHQFISAHRDQGRWQITLCNREQQEVKLASRCLINAAGIRVNEVQGRIVDSDSRCWIESKRKLFMLIPKFYQGDHAYLIETAGSPISVTPYLEHFCLVSRVTGIDTDGVSADPSPQEQADLIHTLNQYFQVQLAPDAVIRCYCIQQPLYCDDREGSPEGVEDYALDLSCVDGRSPLISIFGGSFATHRAMAEEAVEMLGHYLPSEPTATTRCPLPGGDLHPQGFDQFILHVASEFPWLPSRLLNHYCRTYGARTLSLLQDCQALADLGPQLCPGLHQREAEFLVQNEWVNSAEDILWRRTRLGLYAGAEDVTRLQRWVGEHLPSPSRSQGYTMWSKPVPPGRMH
ncbi:MAG: FAD-dependent oxidoreductase [Pseudomonadota bacterium]|nr:FAD-dependent oxidoreductase [Pseudomonadota bacterium]